MLRITLAWQTVGISKSARLHFFYGQLYGGGCRATGTKVIHFDFIFWPLRLIRRIKLWWLDNFGFQRWRSLRPNLRWRQRRRNWNLRHRVRQGNHLVV